MNDRRKRFSDCIDLWALETESRPFLATGAFAGMLVLAVAFPLMPGVERGEGPPLPAERTMRVTLVFIPVGPKGTGKAAPPVKKSAAASRPDASPPPVPEPPPRTVETVGAPAIDGSLVMRLRAPSLPDFRDAAGMDSSRVAKGFCIAERERLFRLLAAEYGTRPETKRRSMIADIPLGDRGLVRLTPGTGAVFFDLFPLKARPPEDERRRYREDLFGIGVGRGLTFGVGPGFAGVNALGLVNTGRHLVKTTIWKHEDAARNRSAGVLRGRDFSGLTLPETRFLVLLWREGRLDAGRLSRRDREFLAGDGLDGVLTFRGFLDRMEKRGLAFSLRVGGRLFHRANVGRDEVLQSLIRRAGGTADSDSAASTGIRLITATVDSAAGPFPFRP